MVIKIRSRVYTFFVINCETLKLGRAEEAHLKFLCGRDFYAIVLCCLPEKFDML